MAGGHCGVVLYREAVVSHSPGLPRNGYPGIPRALKPRVAAQNPSQVVQSPVDVIDAPDMTFHVAEMSVGTSPTLRCPNSDSSTRVASSSRMIRGEFCTGSAFGCRSPKLAVIFPEMVMHIKRLRAMIGVEFHEC